MYRVELYAQVRRSVFVEGLSEREAAKRFGLARGTVRKMLRYATPPGYRRRQPAQRPKLDPFTGIVDQILIDDQERPKKQRHTAKRIFDRLRDEYDFTGGYTIVKDYVRDKKLGGKRCSCRWCIRRAMPRPTSVKLWWSLTAYGARRTTWWSICRLAMTLS